MDLQESEDLLYQSQIHGQAGQSASASAAAQYYVQEQEKTLADAQLECEKILEKVRHMLRQDQKVYKEDGSIDWVEVPQSERMLTEVGINRIMQTMEAYVNKESLLSNYDDKIINRRMLEFSLALNGNLFMKYELYFRLPTVEEAIVLIKKRIEESVNVKVFARELFGIKPDKEKLKEEALAEIENKIEHEIQKVRKEKQFQNMKEYELLFTELRAIVESVHQRAWRGEERGSLRRHTNIAEIIGGRPTKQEGGGMFKWIKG